MRFALAAVFALACQAAHAQFVTVYSPVVAAPVVPAPTVVYRPVVPVATPYLVASPVVSAPVVAAPVVAAPPAVVTRTLAPTPIVTTRYRPILGGTVTRVRYGYAPVNVVTPLY